MNNSQFLKYFFEIEADKNYIVVFSGDHLIFPIILEFPKNEHRLNLSWINIFYISKKTVRKAKKESSFLN